MSKEELKKDFFDVIGFDEMEPHKAKEMESTVDHLLDKVIDLDIVWPWEHNPTLEINHDIKWFDAPKHNKDEEER